MARVLANWSFTTDLSANFDGANLRKNETNYSLLRLKTFIIMA